MGKWSGWNRSNTASVTDLEPYFKLLHLLFSVPSQAVILARARCGVSLTAQRTGGLPAGNSESIVCRKRPVSAPLTRDEVRKAELSTDVIKGENSRKEKSTMPGYKWESTRTRPHTSHHGSTFSPRTLKTSSVRGVRESLVPTLVNFSGQDLENL